MRAATAKLENFVLSVSPIAEIGYQRTYSASSLILLFFIFSGMGWIWEVILHIIEDGMIINRGVLAGPWLPIYGAGGILILLLLKKWRRQPFHLFGMIMLLCGTIEYFTSVMLEMLFGVRWWDYSDMLFQLRGRYAWKGLLSSASADSSSSMPLPRFWTTGYRNCPPKNAESSVCFCFFSLREICCIPS